MTTAMLAALALAAAQAASASPATPAAPKSVAMTVAADGTTSLVNEAIVEAPAADVWQAVSTAQGWTTWAVPVAWQDGDFLETSYSRTAKPGDATTIRQQILAREPDRRLTFRTVKAPEGFPNFDAYRQVVSTFELEPLGEARTRVRLISVGYPDSDAGRELLMFFAEGNQTTLEQLRARFVSGPIDWNNRR